jgi:hypothetical protein
MPRKHLMEVALSGFAAGRPELLMDVNKTGQLRKSSAWA